MRRLFLFILLAALLVAPLAIWAQDEGEMAADSGAMMTDSTEMASDSGEMAEPVDTTPVIRNAYYTLPNDPWNFFTMAAMAPLQSTYLQATGVDGFVLIAPDTIGDSLVLKAQFDLANLSTGEEALDTMFFSKNFLQIPDTMSVVNLNLLRVTQLDDYVLINEVQRKITATAEMTMGTTVDTVVVTMGMTYLEQNDVTARKLPGNLLHIVADYSFRLSVFGIKIPRPALLKLPDRLNMHLDFFLTSENPDQPMTETE